MKKLWILLVAAMLAVGCNDDKSGEVGELANQLTLDTESLNYLVDGTSAGATDGVVVTADGDWRLVGYQSWCTPSATSGKSGDKVTFAVGQNPSDDARSATYTFIRGNKAVKLTVTQLQNSVFELVNGGAYTVNSRSQTVTFIVRSNFDIVPQTDVPWITDTDTDAAATRGAETRYLRFLVSENDTYDNRDGKIVIADIEGVSHELTISQNQKHAMVLEKKLYDMEAAGGLISVAMDANVDCTVTIGAGYSSWIEAVADNTRALAPTQKVFRIAESAETRQGRLIFKYSPTDGSTPLVDTVLIAQRVGPTVKVDVPDFYFRYVLAMSDYVISTPGETMCEMTAKGTALTSLTCSNWTLNTLKGVEAFVNLTTLNCSNNNLTSLDLSALPALKTLNCSSNQLETLDLKANTELTSLNCNYNKLSVLDVSSLTALATLNCTTNQIEALDLNAHTALATLSCSNNAIRKLDLTACAVLKSLSPSTNPLEEILLHPAANITSVSLYSLSNPAGTVKSSRLKIAAAKVTSISCFLLKLEELDITGCPALTSINCSDNLLTRLDLSGNANLKTLNCYNNKLATLDVQPCTALTTLSCYGNQLTTLDVAVNTALTSLRCHKNQLSALDVTTNTALTTIDCNTNALKTLDVSSNIKLATLNCSVNPDLTTLYMAQAQEIRTLILDEQTQIVRK